MIAAGSGAPELLSVGARALLEKAEWVSVDRPHRFLVGRARSIRPSEVIPRARAGDLVARVVAGVEALSAREAAQIRRSRVDFTVVPGSVGPPLARREWLKIRPLFGFRIAVTRAAEQAGGFCRALADLGAHVVEFPTIEIRPTVRPRIPPAEVLLFTSQNGVEFYFRRLREEGRDARSLGETLVAAVGPATASALDRHGILADLVSGEFTSEALARQVAPICRGRTVLHAAADKANVEVREILTTAGARYLKATLYRIVPARRVRWTGGDLVTFASAETARRFAAMVRARPPAACIGPVTVKAARRAGFPVAAVAREYTIPGLLEAILRWAQ